MTARFIGLTWDHPRGFNALSAAAQRVAPSGLLHWAKHPLEDFESRPIGDVAARFDLIVLDHPHIGEASALGCLRPLDEIFRPDELARNFRLISRIVSFVSASFGSGSRIKPRRNSDRFALQGSSELLGAC